MPDLTPTSSASSTRSTMRSPAAASIRPDRAGRARRPCARSARDRPTASAATSTRAGAGFPGRDPAPCPGVRWRRGRAGWRRARLDGDVMLVAVLVGAGRQGSDDAGGGGSAPPGAP